MGLLCSYKKNIFVSGRTQTGKTRMSVGLLKVHKGPGLFFNPQHVHYGRFVLADMHTDVEVLFNALRSGHKVEYRPSFAKKIAKGELDYLMGRIQADPIPGLMVLIDETHFYSRDGAEGPLGDYIRTNLGRGMVGVFVTQSGADTSKALLRQAEIKVFFDHETEDEEYYRNKKYPVAEIVSLLRKGNIHSFVVYRDKQLSGPYSL